MRFIKQLADKVFFRPDDDPTPADELYFALVRTGLQVEVRWQDEPEWGRVRVVSHPDVTYIFTANGRHLLVTK